MSTYYLVYYGIICWLLLVPIQAQQGENASQQKSDEAQSRISQPTVPPANNSNVKKPEGPIQEAKPSENKTDGSGQGVTRAEWMQIGINGLLFIVVLWQTLIYIQQRNIMRQQVAHARISERAYIGIKQIGMEHFTVGATPVVRLTIVNGGRTPAYKLKTPGHMTFTKAGQPFPHERPESSETASESFLPAGSPINCSFPFFVPWTSQWAHAIETQQYFIFLHVEARFTDAWGDEHVMPFKLAYRATDKRWGEYRNPKDSKPIITIT
jgi:hypothetical protein